jgi:hypothetical protein
VQARTGRGKLGVLLHGQTDDGGVGSVLLLGGIVFCDIPAPLLLAPGWESLGDVLAHLIYSILQVSGVLCSVIGTVGSVVSLVGPPFVRFGHCSCRCA